MAITDATILDPSIDRRLAVDLDASESDRLLAYRDSLGYWTCGRGHLMPQGRSWEGFRVTQAASDGWFSNDILKAIRLASALPEMASCNTQCRKNALYELVFNMGGRWKTFTRTRAAVVNRQWKQAHDNLLASLWARQVQPHGLDKPGRATRIAKYFLIGEYV